MLDGFLDGAMLVLISAACLFGGYQTYDSHRTYHYFKRGGGYSATLNGVEVRPDDANRVLLVHYFKLRRTMYLMYTMFCLYAGWVLLTT